MAVDAIQRSKKYILKLKERTLEIKIVFFFFPENNLVARPVPMATLSKA